MKRFYKYCPRCREELNKMFEETLKKLDRNSLIKLCIGLKGELDSTNEK